MDIVDIWVNLVTETSAREFVTTEGYENIPGYLGSNTGPVGVDSLVALMDELGVATGIFTSGLDHNTEKMLEICDAHPGRFLVAGGIGDPSRPGRQVRRIRELAQHPRFALVRVMPLSSQVPTNDARHYPIYQVCEELGLPVAINAGIPGPRVRSPRATSRAARRRADRLPRSRRDRRAHGASVRRAAHELHAEVVEPLRELHGVRAAVHGPESREVHEHEDVSRTRALGQRRTVVPDATLARGGTSAAARRRSDGVVPRRHRATPARPVVVLIDTAHRRAAIGGIVGPVAFVGAWLTLGATTDQYSPVDDAISRLAAVHASTRPAMTAAFVVFGLGMAAYAWALRPALTGASWIAALVSGIATLGVAAFPLDHSDAVDRLHGVCAGTGYVALAGAALLAVAPLTVAGRIGWARCAAITGTIAGIALALTLLGPHEGFFQRLGLTAGDVWIVASAIAVLRGSSLAPRR